MSPPLPPKPRTFYSVCLDGSLHPQVKGVSTLPLLRIRYFQHPVLSVLGQDSTSHALHTSSI